MGAETRVETDQANEYASATEHEVAALWEEVLQTGAAPRATDNFFERGGDSVAMVTLLFRISEELSVELPDGALLSAPSLRALSALVDAARQV